MMHRKYSLRRRIIMAIREMRDINSLAECSVTCPNSGCGGSSSSETPPYQCQRCYMIWG